MSEREKTEFQMELRGWSDYARSFSRCSIESHFSPLAVGRKLEGYAVRGASPEDELHEKRDQNIKESLQWVK